MATRRNQAVLFDLDGVIIPTENIKGQVHAQTVASFGGNASPSLYVDYIGRSHEDVRRAYITASGIEIDPEAYTRTFRQIYHALLESDLAFSPGVQELLGALARQGYRLALVSSSSLSSISLILNKLGLTAFFDTVVTADDVSRKKPAPDAYLAALDRLSLSSAQAIVFEDSQVGIQAALAANLTVIAVRHASNHKQDFSLAFTLLDSLADTPSILRLIETLFSRPAPDTAS
jgi:HAD superfamily hydrolase (TIGR01509 family)